MDLLTPMQAALTAAQAAVPGCDRYLLAGGPEVALTCHMVAVYPGPLGTKNMGACAYQGVPSIVVAYAKDCYPLADPDKAGVLPPVAEVTAWTTAWVTDIAALWNELLAAVEAGAFGGSCTGVTLQTGNFAGPRGGVCSVRIPIMISGTD